MIERRGPTLPFEFSPVTEFTIGNRNETLKSALETLFGTMIGEHPWEKDFGHDLLGILFLNQSETSRTIAENLVRNLLSIYEDELVVLSVNVGWDKKNNDRAGLRIRIQYQDVINPLSVPQSFESSV